MIISGRDRSIRSADGFTLLEMIVAVTLVAMMAVGLWAVFTMSIRSWSRGTQFIDKNQRHRSILDMVRKQMASAYGLYGQADQESGKASRLIFNGTENAVRFISLNSLQFQESPGLTLVSYEVASDSSGDYSLVEKETRYLGQTLGQESPMTANRAIPIFENLSSCVFEYFDPGRGDEPPGWVREWDGQQLGRLPMAVSMTMISRDPKGNTLSRHMVVPIHAEAGEVRANVISPFSGRRAVVR
jgi:prepilin-type N-terminal cleavage/methylation domain-containing protein